MCLPAHKEKMQQQSLVYTRKTSYKNKVLLHTRGQDLIKYTYTAAAVRFSVTKNTNKTSASTNKIIVGISACVQYVNREYS